VWKDYELAPLLSGLGTHPSVFLKHLTFRLIDFEKSGIGARHHIEELRAADLRPLGALLVVIGKNTPQIRLDTCRPAVLGVICAPSDSTGSDMRLSHSVDDRRMH
jgi:hypothetical protein